MVIDFLTLPVTVALEIILKLLPLINLVLENMLLKPNGLIFTCTKINAGSSFQNFGHIHSFTVLV